LSRSVIEPPYGGRPLPSGDLGRVGSAHCRRETAMSRRNSSLTIGLEAVGQPFLAAVRLKIEEGWHVYWENPGSPGGPPRVTWNLPDGYTASPLLFPVPHRHPTGSFTSYGYEHEAVLLTTISPPSGAGIPDLFGAEVNWLVCANTCIPGKASLNWRTGDPSWRRS